MRKLAFCLFCVQWLGAAITWAETFNVSTSEDSFVSSANPANNYGGAGGIAISASALTQGELQSLLKFNLAGALANFDTVFGSGNWTLDGATLQLTATNAGNPVFNTSAAGLIAATWLADDGWVEGSGTPMVPTVTGINFNSLPALLAGGQESLGLLNFNGATSGTGNYSLSMSPGLVSDALAGGIASIRLVAGDSAVSGVFNSRSFATVASRPVLVLSAVQIPEPAACAMISVAILAGLCRCPQC